MTQFMPLFALSLVLSSFGARADEVGAMKTAFQLIETEEWEAAHAVAPTGIGKDFVTWSRLREGEGNLGEYEAFLAARGDWPGLALLRQKGEEAVARSMTPSRVINYFGAGSPRTAEGAIALVVAMKAAGQFANAETVAMEAWANLRFTAEEEVQLRGLMPESIGAVDELRLENLLWAERRAEALRLLPQVDAGRQALAKARLALAGDQQGVDALIEAVPPALANDPGLQWERFAWRMRRDNYDSASALLLAMPPEALGRPETWAPRRALLTRWLLRQGRAGDAYRIASAHGLERGSNFADLEFLAGFIALRQLNKPAEALAHFAKLRANVSTGISVSRADYWQGRAAEALGRKSEAEGFYRAAARHQTAYYGQLAGERLGLPLNAALISSEYRRGWQEAPFARSSVLQAARIFAAAGNKAEAKRFLLHLSESLNDDELSLLAGMALEMKEMNFAVILAKVAAERGVILPAAYYPVPSYIPEGLKVSRALAMSIARRESEFDPLARSHADAQGLMQVLPGTAQLMAKELDLPYAAGKLFSDPTFNVTVGSAYLAKMIEEFGPSVALVAAGYNAGPGRPRRWISEIGDPRRPDVDVVDWVETIPFAETRTYIMRVSESLVIYRAKLKGAVGPIRLTAELKG